MLVGRATRSEHDLCAWFDLHCLITVDWRLMGGTYSNTATIGFFWGNSHNSGLAAWKGKRPWPVWHVVRLCEASFLSQMYTHTQKVHGLAQGSLGRTWDTCRLFIKCAASCCKIHTHTRKECLSADAYHNVVHAWLKDVKERRAKKEDNIWNLNSSFYTCEDLHRHNSGKLAYVIWRI